MNEANLRALIRQQQDICEAMLAELTPASVPSVAIGTSEAFDRALSLAAPGAVLALTEEFVYSAPLTLRKPVTIVCPAAGPPVRLARDLPLPRFHGGVWVESDNIALRGVEVRNLRDPLTDVLRVTGGGVTLDRIRVLGDPVKGAKRGISTNGNGSLKVLRCYVADCFQASPGNDSQALGGWDMAPGLLVEDCYLEGGSETVLFGGADSAEDRVPRDLVIRGNTITKRPEWMGKPIGVKNLVEFKNAKNVLFENNDCRYSWTQGQTGYLLVLTIRNQDGNAPWATLQDLTFRNNQWTDGGGAINLLGRDDIKEVLANRPVLPGVVRPSIPMRGVHFIHERFALGDVAKWAKSTNAKILQLGGGPADVTFEDVEFSATTRAGSALYFTSAPPPEVPGLTLHNVTFPQTTYGMFGEGVSAKPTNWTPTNPAWAKYVKDGVLGPVTVTAA